MEDSLDWDPTRLLHEPVEGFILKWRINDAENIKTMGCPPNGAVGTSESRGGGLDSIILESKAVHHELQAPSINTRLSAFSTGFQYFFGPVFVALPILLVLERVILLYVILCQKWAHNKFSKSVHVCIFTSMPQYDCWSQRIICRSHFLSDHMVPSYQIQGD